MSTPNPASCSVTGPSHYYPGGMLMPGRQYVAASPYNYGYQGSLKDDEISGHGNFYSTYFRELDVRTQRWWGLDPETAKTPWESPYVTMNNNPISRTDILGNTGNDWRILKAKDGTSLSVKYSPGDAVHETDASSHISSFGKDRSVDISGSLFPAGGSTADANMASVSLELTAGPGQMHSLDFVSIHKGEDKGGVFAYYTVGVGGGFSVGASFTAGDIDFNEASGFKLNRETFAGYGEAKTASIYFGAYESVKAYTNGGFCGIPFYNCGNTVTYSGDLSGVSAGLQDITAVNGAIYRTHATLLFPLRESDAKRNASQGIRL